MTSLHLAVIGLGSQRAWRKYFLTQFALNQDKADAIIERRARCGAVQVADCYDAARSGYALLRRH